MIKIYIYVSTIYEPLQKFSAKERTTNRSNHCVFSGNSSPENDFEGLME